MLLLGTNSFFHWSSNLDYWHCTIKQQCRSDVIMHQNKRILHRVIWLNVCQSLFCSTSWNASTVWKQQYTVRKQNTELSSHIELGCWFSTNTKRSKRQVTDRLPPVAICIKYFLYYKHDSGENKLLLEFKSGMSTVAGLLYTHFRVPISPRNL